VVVVPCEIGEAAPAAAVFDAVRRAVPLDADRAGRAPRGAVEVSLAIGQRLRRAGARVLLLLDEIDAPAEASVASLVAHLSQRGRGAASVVCVIRGPTRGPVAAARVEHDAELVIDADATAAWIQRRLFGDQPGSVDPGLIGLAVRITERLGVPPLGVLSAMVDSLALRGGRRAVLSDLYPLVAAHHLPAAVGLLCDSLDEQAPEGRALRAVALLEVAHLEASEAELARWLWVPPRDPTESNALRAALVRLRERGALVARAPDVDWLATSSALDWLHARERIEVTADEVSDLIIEALRGVAIADIAATDGEVGRGGLRVLFGDGHRAHEAPVLFEAGDHPRTIDVRHVAESRRAEATWLNNSGHPSLAGRVVWIAGGDHASVLAAGREVARSRHQIRRATPVLKEAAPDVDRLLSREARVLDVAQERFRAALVGSLVRGELYVEGRHLPREALPDSGADLAAALRRAWRAAPIR
jgi:hypothetical protein